MAMRLEQMGAATQCMGRQLQGKFVTARSAAVMLQCNDVVHVISRAVENICDKMHGVCLAPLLGACTNRLSTLPPATGCDRLFCPRNTASRRTRDCSVMHRDALAVMVMLMMTVTVALTEAATAAAAEAAAADEAPACEAAAEADAEAPAVALAEAEAAAPTCRGERTVHKLISILVSCEVSVSSAM